ncbi:MAG TPA: murein biosynthesis integral membrane protein MurJ, partial [Thermoanaerobaculia bacterium]|nr:murein biosynthesis integral membrane protein MurJ [Thermoanaerobaculia bacterium]
MSDARKVVRATWGITAWTAVSRLAGVLRDATIARFLGASALSDAFYTAFRIPNTFRAIVGEGGLPGAFVPMAKRVARERPGEEGAYAGRVLSLLLLVLVALTALGIALSPLLVSLFAAGFRETPGKFELTVALTRWLFPYVLLVSVAALLEAWLNAHGRFQLSAATPVAFNLAIVAAVWLLAPRSVSPTTALVIGVLLGGLAQASMQIPAARRLGFRLGGSPFGDPAVRETVLLIAPRLYGYGVGQLSFLVSSRTLAAIGDAYVTFNFCAFRVVDFVLGGFVVSLTRAVLPSLSEQALEHGRESYRATLTLALRLVGFVTIPSMVGLLLIARPVIDVIFRRGRFEAADVTQTAIAVLFFALGLYAAAGVKILTQAFYALHDTKTPVAVATFDLGVFWLLCVGLAGPMKHAGVALATSAGFWVNFVLLALLLRRKLGPLGGREVVRSLARTLGASLVMGAAVLAVAQRLLPYDASWGFLARAGWVVGPAAGGGLLFVAAAAALGAREGGGGVGGVGR